MTLPSLATRARRVLDAASVERGATVLVACSGGLDSQVLLDVLSHVAKAGRVRLAACSIDHGLRAAARDEIALVEKLAAERNVELHTVELQVPTGANLQARAREARWTALRDVAQRIGASHIATAHHRDDRAETVLIRILRGAPIEGLAVLEPHTHERVRPLIDAPRSQLLAHARRRGLVWAEDPSNVDPRYLRTRVRAEVLPLLRTLDPRIEEHLVALAEGASRLVAEEKEAFHEDPLTALPRGASARARAALRDAAVRKDPRLNVLLPGGNTASWDQQGEIVITGGARWHGRRPNR